MPVLGRHAAHRHRTKDTTQLFEYINKWGREDGCLHPGDRIVLVAGTGLGTGGHNLVLVNEVK